ncbi:MAG: spore coat protein CotH [Clostridia bacterium]|nr:spore coat protein CotH [Clostridia bacterium]
MKHLKICAVFLICAIMTSCGANEVASSSTATISVPKQEQSEIITDKKLLYKNDDSNLAVKTLYLTVRRGNDGENTNHSWGEINSYSVFDYERMGVDRYKVEAILQEGDENGPLAGGFGYGLTTPNATVQIRGQTSSKYAQKNYKIEIKKDAGSLAGQTTIALNRHMLDSLRLRNKLCFDLMAQIPQMLSLQTQFVHLYVKDETRDEADAFTDYGFYTQVEQPNKTALAAHGMDTNGQLYKINYFEFFRYADVIKLKSEESYDKKAFEELLEIKGNDDHTKLIDMLDDVNNYSMPIEDVCGKYFDMDNMLTWMAFHILMGNIDTQSRNVYIYSPLNSEKWYFWSWDNDGALEQTTRLVRGNSTARGWEYGISNY